VVCGRQTGKTTLALHEAVKLAVGNPGFLIYWVSPTHDLASKAFEKFLLEYPQPVRQALSVKTTRAPSLQVRFQKNDSRILFRTAQNPDSLVSDTLDFVVVDEAGLISDSKVFYQAILPSLGVKNAKALFITTPREKNWVYQLYQTGWKDNVPQYQSFHFPTTPETSGMSQEEIELARTAPGMTEDRFRAEYLAEFIEEDSDVFRNYRKCVKGRLEEPQPFHRYAIGVDIGRMRDFTVISVLDRECGNHLVHFQRFQHVDWPIIHARIVAVWSKYNRSKITVDSSGVGDAFCFQLAKDIPNLEPFNMGSVGKKANLVEALIGAVERQDISFPVVPDLIRELGEFTGTLTVHGNRKYSAPKNQHDDTVISLALAYWLCRRKPIKQLTPRQAKLLRRQF